jgi:hypothetical protein
MHYYKQAIANLQLYGPTNFAEFINRTAEVGQKRLFLCMVS